MPLLGSMPSQCWLLRFSCSKKCWTQSHPKVSLLGKSQPLHTLLCPSYKLCPQAVPIEMLQKCCGIMKSAHVGVNVIRFWVMYQAALA